MRSHGEPDEDWDQPERTGRARAVWVVAAIAAAGVLGGLVGGFGGEEEGLPVDERDAELAVDPLDGAEWERHTSLDHVVSVAPASDGGVWAATRSGGLVRWDADGDYEHHPLGDEVAGEVVTALAAGDDGSVWMATEPEGPGPAAPAQRGLAHFDGDTWTAYASHNLPVTDGVAELAVADDGAVWVGTRVHGHTGLAHFDGDTWTTHSTDDGLPAGELTSLTIDDDGAVWAATNDGGGPDASPGGVARYDGDEWTAWHAGDDFGIQRVTTVATGGGRVWATGHHASGGPVDGTAVLRFDDGTWVTALTADETRLDPINMPTVDHEGALWAATRRGRPPEGMRFGVVRLTDDGEVSRWTADEALPDSPVASLAAADDGAVWAATQQGVARFDGQTWATHATGQGPAGGHVVSAAAGHDGDVWVGTFNGLSRFADGEWRRWTADDDGLAGDVVEALAVADGTVWAGTDEGVSRFDGNEWTTWGDDELGHARVLSLAVAADGEAWAVTRNGSPVPLGPWASPGEHTEGGLASFDGETWRRHPDLPLDGPPAAVTVGDDGAVWVAARSVGGDSSQPPRKPGGIARFADGEWTSWTAADGLPTSDVLAVDAANGTVWAGTWDGIARFDGPRWVDATAEGDPLNLEPGEPAATDPVNVVAADADTVWVGSNPAWSVARFDGWAWTVPEQAPGLGVGAIALTADAAWLGTDGGVLRAPR